jgi:dimethylamine monooxygenase subunit A
MSKGTEPGEGDCRDQENDGGTARVIHTPYDGSSKPFQIGLKPLDSATWIEVDDNLEKYLAEKNRLYTEETANVLVAEAGTEAAQQEVLDLVVDHLTHYFPTQRCHPGEGRDPALPHIPALDVKLDPGLRRDDGVGGEDDDIKRCALARAALLVQEDLVLMRHSPQGWRLVAASLCFPSAWNLHEKFGRPMQDIHQPVPGFGPGTRNAGLIDRMFDNLRVEQPVIRWNWSLYGDARLYHPATDNKMKNRFGVGPLSGNVIMRLERQTLRKLPKSGDILFTIRIHNNPLEVLETHVDGPALARSIATQVANLTDAEVDYKGLVGERERLLQRLETLASNART